MIIKKYIGKTEEEATEAARKELGEGIVIMNVRPAKRDGFFSFLLPAKVEVTVALEDEPQEQQTVTPMKLEQTAPAPARPVIKPVQENATPAMGRTQISAYKQQMKQSGQALPPTTAIRDAVSEVSRIIERGLDSEATEQTPVQAPAAQKPEQEAPAQKTPKVPAPEKTPEPTPAPAKQDTAEKTTPSADVLSFIKVLYNTLLENEVDEIYINQLTDEVEKYSRPGVPLEHQLANVYQKMVLKFGTSEPVRAPGDHAIAEIFIGPTGVGKTTTIAKLASELYVRRKAKVALLTVDTYRIAAAEQLRTYASILEIPFRVVYSVDEMKQAAEDFKDYDYVMVDTAGHNIANEEQRETTVSFIRALESCMDTEKYLVLSATTKYRDLLKIVDGYSDFTDYKLIFTKMDETRAAGNLYNIHMYTGAAMSYTTDGQNVPDDIALFDAQHIVKGLLGGSGH
ncbi:MAG: AAA family ATPase [Butyrivibrio sp.]|nr:AAA family ATPase [Butyrivibrio sp.]